MSQRNGAMPLRCTYRVVAVLVVVAAVGVGGCSNVSTRPGRDLDEHSGSMKPSRRATSTLRHKCLSSVEERGRGFHLRAILLLLLLRLRLCLLECQHTGISASPRSHWGFDDGAADSSTGGISMESKESEESGQRDGYVRACVFVVEEEKIRSAFEKQTTLPRRRCAASSATTLISRSGCR